jgi:hypothetical protein
MKGRGYTALRRKSWYPRKKQPRWLAKLGCWQRLALQWLYFWDEGRQISVFPLYKKDLQANVRRLMDTGIVWQPRRMAIGGGSEGRPLTAQQRVLMSRALHGLAARGMVELIPFPGTRRTHMVKLTKRGLQEAKRIVSLSNLLT